MMTIQRAMMVCVILVAMPLQAFGLATEHHGNAPIGPGWNFPADVVRVADLPSRVYWREINGDPRFFFRGNTAGLNQALEAFAQIQGEKEILLLPGPSDVRTLVERKPVPCDWELHAPNGSYVHFAKQEKGTQVMTKRFPCVTMPTRNWRSWVERPRPSCGRPKRAGRVRSSSAASMPCSISWLKLIWIKFASRSE